MHGKRPVVEYAITVFQKEIVVVNNEDRQRFLRAVGDFGCWNCIFRKCNSDASPAMISGLTRYSPVIPINTKEVKIVIVS